MIEDKSIKLVICDCDGTILDDAKNLDSGLVKIIPELSKRGIIFSLASGRNIFLLLSIVDKLKIDSYYITDNGGNIYLKDQRIISNSISRDYNNILNKYFSEHNIPFLMYTDKALHYFKKAEKLDIFKKRLIDKMSILPYNEYYDYSQESCFKMTLDSATINNMSEVIEVVKKECPEINFKQSEGSLYTITACNATKGKALVEICKMLDISTEEVMAFGDNHNDSSLLEAAGTSVAMSNSEKELLESADYICGDNNHNGVSEFIIETFKLNI